MSSHDASVDDTAAFDYEPATDEDWFEETDELPRRRRRRLLGPVPAVLFAILLLAGGFLAGVEVQKNQGGSSTSGSGLAGFAALRAAAKGSGAAGATRSSSGGFAGGAGFGGAGGLAGAGITAGEVSYLSGNTLYVTNTEGNTVKVSAPSGTKVSKTVSTSVSSIHPGDTVLVRGSQSAGKVTASSISVTASGSTTGSSGGTSSSSSSSATPQLFGGG
jgi:hypothetical protein